MGSDSKYLAGEADASDYGEPDEDSPEWTEATTLWAVKIADFPSLSAAEAFLFRRAAFLRAAEAAGVPRDAFLPFDPGKPGFEERARKALTALPKAVGWAAE